MVWLIVTTACITIFSIIVKGSDTENCPDGWHYYQQRHKCFLLDDTPLIWNQAVGRCEEHGGRLTTIPDAQTNEFLTGLIIHNCAAYWIGLHDRATEGVFQWVDGKDLSNFTYWAPGEPNSLGDEDCVCISANRNSRWNDAFCGTYFGYSCERPARNTHSPTMIELVIQKRTKFPVIDTDTAPPVIDASTAPPDIDAGTTPTDIDAGTTPPDIDASTAPPDIVAGTAPPDIDAGTAPPVIDAGTATPEIDAGTATPEIDEGTTPPVIDIQTTSSTIDTSTAPPEIDAGTTPPVIDIQTTSSTIDTSTAPPVVDINTTPAPVVFGLLSWTYVGVAKLDSRCYSCSGITNPHNCDKIVQCDSSQQCFTRSYISDSLSVLFDLGCLDNGFCAILPPRARTVQADDFSPSDDYVAEVTSEEESTRQKRQKEAPLCTQCCDNDEHCNSDLCPNSLISRPPGRKCYDCGSVLLDDPAECTTIRVCAPGQECHVTEVINPVGTKFQVNCMSKQLCQAIGNNTSFGKRDRYLCRTCCDADYCNIDYCSNIRDLPTDASVTDTSTTNVPSTTTTTTVSTTTTTKIVALQSVEAPQNATLFAGEKIEYTCEVTGFPLPSLKWLFKDTNGQTQSLTNKAVTSATKSTLTLNAVSMADEGTYTCVAENGIQTLELQGTLTVHEALQWIQRPQNETLQAGGILVLGCEAKGVPLPTLTWRFDGSNGQSEDITKKAVTSGSKSTLTLDPVLITDEGNYTCIADNGFEALESSGALLVYTKLFLSSSPASDMSPTEGDNLTLQCAYDGYPKPTVKWFRVDGTTGNQVAPTNLKTEDNGRTAILDNINRTDSGLYVCEGDNSFDKKTQQVNIDVLFAPEFQTPAVQLFDIKENDTLTFNCHAEGNPKPGYSFWFLDSFNNPAVIPGVILDSDVGTMTIPQAPQNMDGGSVTCVAVNKVAGVQRTAAIHVTS